MPNDPSVEYNKPSDLTCDLLVIGSGAGGLSTAVTAAAKGLDVIVAEKEPEIGGTTAYSGGWLWIPHAPQVIKDGITEDGEAPKRYLRSIVGNRYNEKLIDRYLETAPEMLDFFERKTAVSFNPGSAVPDFHGHLKDAAKGGRSVVAAPYDGRELGSLINKLAKPIPETTLLGMGIAAGADMRAFLTVFRSFPAFRYVTKRLLRHIADICRYGRSMQIVNGNALVARLLKSCDIHHVRLLTEYAAQSLIKNNQSVEGAIFHHNGQLKTIKARYGVVLATGGFPHDPLRQAALFPHVAHGTPHHSAAPLSNTGEGLNIAEQAGGIVDRTQFSAGAWAPVSLVPRKDGTVGRFPHLVERGKPGIISVRENGKRFVYEDGPYYDFIAALIEATPHNEPVKAWLIADHHFVRRYGLGAVKPFPVPLTKWLRNGYLKRANSLNELAKLCGIDAIGLEQTVSRYNEDAVRGEDNEFHRGSTAYQRAQGDPDHKPNPCIAPLCKAPFYAVEILPGSLGTFAGLICDEDGRVLDAHEEAIQGLFAAGNDMNSIFGGTYPSGGITLGPAMTFGYIIGKNAAEQHQKNSFRGD